AVRAAGATLLRGGAYKPRTSPYDFQGLGEHGLRLLAEASAATGLPVVTEVMDPRDVEMVMRYAAMLQIGARNMQAFTLLREVGQTNMPVLLKRGPAASIKEWLLAAEYILAQGNPNVVLCERGIRGMDAEFTRNVFDLNAIAVAKMETHLPVIADPSHGTGRSELVPPMARAAIAVGADGLIVEVHPNPSEALSDGRQSLDPATFATMMQSLRPHASALGRPVATLDPAA
ncbi:MAG: 3-deoxy-7-phosphoheptulonate synthase, partial [Dehalococcoidia bacterium]|nr:3-deoxy-7-phosphoheptulonate synthase [Dehalococcoidia bacterium]